MRKLLKVISNSASLMFTSLLKYLGIFVTGKWQLYITKEMTWVSLFRFRLNDYFWFRRQIACKPLHVHLLTPRKLITALNWFISQCLLPFHKFITCWILDQVNLWILRTDGKDKIWWIKSWNIHFHERMPHRMTNGYLCLCCKARTSGGKSDVHVIAIFNMRNVDLIRWD